MNDVMNIDKILLLKNETNSNNICLLHFLMFLTTNFSAYYDSYDLFINKRQEIKNNIEYLLSKDIPTCTLKDVIAIPICNFYLSYQGLPSVDIFTLKSKLIRKICPELNYSIDTNFKNEKINICFFSNFLTRWHSVFKDRHQVIKGLADLEDKYNVYFCTFDDLMEEVKYLFGKAKHIKLPQTLHEIRDVLEKLKLDVLVYCEIGMDSKPYFMAHMKLAKIQINTWGHSDTCGIDTIDYFYSSKYYELPYEESQTHYSEKLVLLDSLCTSYVNPISRYNLNTFKDRFEFGFTDEVVVFFCAQSLFKFNPLFDEYIINILNKNKNFVLAIINNESKSKVFKRFNNKNITSQIHIFPPMHHHTYLNLIYISDIVLDPYPFGGCNSSLESFSMNKVVVTHASNMINGRFTTGFYKKMELDNLITYNKEDYINLAVKLGEDKTYRESIENQIKEKHSILFNEQESIKTWDNAITQQITNL
jgi:predicted O-linked N-acetylglucosamine transferase (SPINDLY family)